MRTFSILILIAMASSNLVFCITGKYETSEGLIDCPTSCFDCSSENFCTHCNQGYFRTNDGKCLECSSNCDGCLSGTECLKCKNNFYLTQGQCNSCLRSLKGGFKSECLGQCLETQHRSAHSFNSNIQECIECPENCYSCSNSNTCTHCKLGYFFFQGSCRACSANCFGCENETNCKKCKEGYTLKDGACFE